MMQTRTMMNMLIAVSALFLLTGPVQAWNEFDGDTDDNFAVAANWEGDHLPVGTSTLDIADIGSSGLSPASVFLDTVLPGSIGGLHVGIGGYDGTLEIRNGGTLSVATYYCRVGRDADSTGKVDILDGGSLLVLNSKVTDFADKAGGSGIVNVWGTFNSTGRVNVGLYGDAELNVFGSGDVDADELYLAYGYTDGSPTGLLTLTDDATVDTVGKLEAGTWDLGAGTDWTIRITDDLGDDPSLHVGGSAVFYKDGLYQPQISGDNIDFAITGSLSLNAQAAGPSILTIEPLALSGLASGDYTVMTYASLTNNGSIVMNDTDASGTWTIKEVGATELVLTYAETAEIPEPGTLLLLGTGALGVIGYLKRKRMK